MAIAMPPLSHSRRPCAPAAAVLVTRADLRRRRAEARYRRRRAAAGLFVTALVGAGVLVVDSVLTGSGGGPASAAGAGHGSVVAGPLVRASAGDSLWSIAEQRHGEVPIRRYVEALIDLNDGTMIEAGQLVRLP